MKAIGMYIFGGSQSIAVMQSGYEIDRVLEISDDILETNAHHFHKNYPNIPIILPSEWHNSEYLHSLRDNDYDLFYANNPCSGLSRINPKASVNNKVNVYFDHVLEAIEAIRPKTFLMENAPTLTTFGLPILKNIVNTLKQYYNITFLSDYAGNHNVAMRRPRTLITGYRKDVLEYAPIYKQEKQPWYSIKDAIGDLYDKELGDKSIPNFNTISHYWSNVTHLYNYVKPETTIYEACIEHIDEFKKYMTQSQIKAVQHSHDKKAMGMGHWDKSPRRSDENGRAPSLTQMALYIHPLQDRDYTIREYARLMGYPDDFVFYPETCSIGVVQCIAQGVPVNFIKYALNEIDMTIKGNRKLSNMPIVYQNNVYSRYQTFDTLDCEKLDPKFSIDKLYSTSSKKLL